MYKNEQDITTVSIANGLIVGLPVNEHKVVCINDFLLWPPDLFALTSQILDKSGAYTNVIAPPTNKPWPPINIPYINGLDWPELTQYLGQEWRKGLELIPDKFGSFENYFKHFQSLQGVDKSRQLIINKIIPLPLIQNIWEKVVNILSDNSEGLIKDFQNMFQFECPNKSIDCHERKVNKCNNCDVWDCFEAVMTLHAICDEACIGWGIRTNNTMKLNFFPETKKGEAQKYAEELLSRNGTLSTINISRGRVLPKRHAPNIGITICSVSSNLAFYDSSVDVKWHLSFEQNNNLLKKFNGARDNNSPSKKYSSNNHSLSILLFPWPFEINSKDFKSQLNPNINTEKKGIGFFSYDPDKNLKDFSKQLIKVIDAALEETSEIDMVILPECALRYDEIKELENVLKLKRIPSYIVGERGRNDNSHFLENFVSFNMIDKNELFTEANRIKQKKHHRWKLDKSQILKYNLGHILSPMTDWWEAININRRCVNFINLGEEITICPLICEDLARQEPISDLIRTVGPTLVVTILMDGPQKLERWSAKYASVLSEDPGCAVVTMTSLGMIKRYQHHHGHASNSIALISDGEGKIMEIELNENAKGVLVNMCLSPKKQSLADGRKDINYTNNLIVGSIHQLVPRD